eukprot:scaffold435_cov107-Cylindrotheca_fusiformis.AAC.1
MSLRWPNTVSVTLPPRTLPPGNIPTMTFDEFEVGEVVTDYYGLTIAGIKVAETDGKKTGIPTSNVITITAPAGEIFGVQWMGMKPAEGAALRCTILGYDADGVPTYHYPQEVNLTTSDIGYESGYDLGQMWYDVFELKFNFSGPSPAPVVIKYIEWQEREW